MTVKCNSKLVTICYPLLHVSTWIWCCLFVAYCLPLPSSTPVQNWERDWLICDGKTELKNGLLNNVLWNFANDQQIPTCSKTCWLNWLSIKELTENPPKCMKIVNEFVAILGQFVWLKQWSGWTYDFIIYILRNTHQKAMS